MASTPQYVVNLSTQPGVPFTVSAAEYERLTELGLITNLIQVIVTPDQVVISTTEPSVAVGTVWFNPNVP